MEAKDLMVGDIVSLFDEDGCIIPTKIKEIRDETVIASIDSDDICDELDYEGIMPIPLTTEILEKCGFQKDCIGHYCYSDDFHDIDIHEYSDSIWYVRIEDTEFTMPTEACSVSYVHQLQHFLRNCKEIKL